MKQQKLFIVKKYIKATSAAEAIRKEKLAPVDDVWVDDNWRKNSNDRLADAMGFTMSPPIPTNE